MIVKEFQATPTTDRYRQAGNRAEQQMAFYLRRAFADQKDLFVINNLRFEHGQEVGQIDHLIVHRGGMILVESKSVTSAVRINERDEWSRYWDEKWKGMASPVTQAGMQAKLLRSYLQAHQSELLNKVMFGKQPDFSSLLMDVLVAISDQGVIEVQGNRPEIRKADQIPEQIQVVIREQTSRANPPGLRLLRRPEGQYLAPEEMNRIIDFLVKNHQEPAGEQTATEKPPITSQDTTAKQQSKDTIPKTVAATTPSTAPEPQQFKCSKCGSSHLQIQFGKSYYFKCLDCGGNTPIHLTCPVCGTQARTRKSGRDFFAVCPKCEHSEKYFVNPQH